jgi:AraC-like DNA-binding protein
VAEYDELIGDLAPDDVPPPPHSRVVFSNLRRGSAVSVPAAGLWIKYVARGAVSHDFGRRTHVVRGGEFLVSPEWVGSEVEVRRGEEGSTVGLCLFLARPHVRERNSAEEPLIFPARCSRLGQALEAEAVRIMRSGLDRRQGAGGLLQLVSSELEGLLDEAAGQLDALPALKRSTRHELLRKLHAARGYLHAVTDRAVPLEELAREAGMSRFELLRQFKLCFGDPPGAYHRQLRLTLAADAMRGGGLSSTEAADRYGFAGPSSLSHAHRRAFGRPPSRPATH